MATRGIQLLKLSFVIGTIADAIVAANWFLIAAGAEIPNMLAGMVGAGADYRFAMYIAALFMTGWTVIFAWGWFNPVERRGLLLITAALLLLSMVLEVALYSSTLGGAGFVLGLSARAALIAKFSFSYFYSRSGEGNVVVQEAR
ncbi:MAG: hypothetical protein JSW51_09750 [Gemmatimonadota bacterium]|nr:MAG: hypothetical protein JSW51_09750 [Gemmatimonadota bacterium]